MNIYFTGMCIAMLLFLGISWLISKKVKNAEDFYVAGRKAPLILIAGSMIASYTSTGMFMGDAAEAYEGALSAMIMFAGMQSVVTGISYKVCIVMAITAFTFISVVSGSRGVLITDTLMAGLFTVSMLVSVIFIAGKAGGWFSAITTLAQAPDTRALLTWEGRPGALYETGMDNMMWGISYGIAWCSVCAIGPWQSSRYLMAKDEHTVVKSGPIAALGVFILEFFVCMTATIINVLNPNLVQSSHVWIWAAMNAVPTFLGVILMTGVLSAGISSATTFLSLIGASAANDLAAIKGDKSIKIGRFVMIVVSLIVLLCAITNPPAIFVIMLLGVAAAASSWMPVAVGCIFSKRITKTGAFCGMLSGMIGCFAANLIKTMGGVNLPSYLDPAIIGIFCNVIAIFIGSSLTHVTNEEKRAREKLFKIQESECNETEIRKTLNWSLFGIMVGVLMSALMLIFWVIPLLMS